MKKIYKYELDISDYFYVTMPKGAEVLTVQIQNSIPCVWALVDTNNIEETYVFRIFGTGQRMPDDFSGKYIGTFQLISGNIVFHLYLE